MPFALTSDPSQSEISEAINYLLANFSAGTTVDPVTGQIIAPTGIILGYLYQYLAVKYADSADGSLNFSNVPTGRTYFGLRNSSDAAESSNPADYIWTKATGGFGSTKFLWYSATGGRQIQIAVATAAPGTGWLQDTGASIDLDVVTSGNIPVIAETFFAYFTPTILQVPRTGSVLTPVFTAVNPVMYATDGGVVVPFTDAQTDSDVSFVNGSWRIGNSSTTGNADISYTNLTIGSPTDAGDYAAWPNPTAMPASPAYITVPVRYKNSLGVVSQAGVATVQLVYADPGATGPSGTQYATAFLYQWATTTPSNPSGTSSYNWTTGVNSGYTGGGSWQTTVGTNPGTPLMQLWIAQIPINATGGTTTTTVNWSSGFTVSAFTQNGATGSSGLNSATVSLYNKNTSTTAPALFSGTFTYTFATGVLSGGTLNGWSQTPPAVASGEFLFISLATASSTSATDTINTSEFSTPEVISGVGTNGANGANTAIVSLFNKNTSSTTPPTLPTGTFTYTFATAILSGGTLNGWTQSAPSIAAGQYLWQQQATAFSTGSTDTILSTEFSTPVVVGGAGANGVQTARPTVYQWAATLPGGPTGTSTYTWSSGSFADPVGWSQTITTSPSAGYTLWAASVSLVDSATATTSTINWTTAGIIASGYAGQTGATGTSGLSSRLTFARVAGNPTPVSGSITTTGSSSYPSSAQSTTTWGFAATWGASDPNPSSTNSLYQADGIYDPSTGNTVWSTPYISSLKVGTLSAITANTGNLTVSGTVQSNTAAISGTTMTGSGGVLYSSGNFAFGNSSNNITYNGTTLTINGAVVAAGNLNVINLNAVSPNTGNLTVSGTITAGTAALSGSTLTGSGVVIYNTGQFAAGNTTNNIVWDNATLKITGTVQSSSSGNRVVLNESSSSYLKVYDSSGNTIYSLLGVAGLYTNSTLTGASALSALNVSNASGYNGTAITGTALGNGHGVSGVTNDTSGLRSGVYGVSSASGSSAAAVYGTNSGNYGLYSNGQMGISNSTVVTNLNANYLQGNQASAFATAALGTDAYAANRLNGSAGVNVLRFVQGTLTGSATATFTGTNKPGTNSSAVWIQITIDGTTLYIPAWT